MIPHEFAGDLKNPSNDWPLHAFLRPTRLLALDGWLKANSPCSTVAARPVVSSSELLESATPILALHVKITDVVHGVTAYEFDMGGGSHGQGHHGTLRASGLGRATTFDLANAAERMYLVLEPNVHRYGARSSVVLR